MKRYEYGEPVMEIIFMEDQDVVTNSFAVSNPVEDYDGEELGEWTGFY